MSPTLSGPVNIYAAPARLEGFGMPQVEAGACEKPVISIKAMGPLDTLVHGETALLAGIAQEIILHETTLGIESGFKERKKIVFETPRIVDYRASVNDIADYLLKLMNDSALRDKLGHAARERVVKLYDYRIVAEQFVKIIRKKLEIK